MPGRRSAGWPNALSAEPAGARSAACSECGTSLPGWDRPRPSTRAPCSRLARMGGHASALGAQAFAGVREAGQRAPRARGGTARRDAARRPDVRRWRSGRVARRATEGRSDARIAARRARPVVDAGRLGTAGHAARRGDPVAEDVHVRRTRRSGGRRVQGVPTRAPWYVARSVPADLRAYSQGKGVRYRPKGQGFEVRLPKAPVRGDVQLGVQPAPWTAIHRAVVTGADYRIVIRVGELAVGATLPFGLGGALADARFGGKPAPQLDWPLRRQAGLRVPRRRPASDRGPGLPAGHACLRRECAVEGRRPRARYRAALAHARRRVVQIHSTGQRRA